MNFLWTMRGILWGPPLPPQVFVCRWLCHNQGLLPLMDENGSEGMRAMLDDAHSTCDIKLDADIFPVALDAGLESNSVSHDCNRTGNKVNCTMWDKNMMHFGKPFVKKMQLLRIQFLLLRHILYVINLPSACWDGLQHPVTLSSENGWDSWELQCCALQKIARVGR